MAEKSLTARVEKVRKLIDSLGRTLAYRKLRAVLNALEVQTEDGDYSRQAVTRLCEALLATAELCPIPEGVAESLETAACAIVSLVEDGR